jgi:alkylhydroperoxidase family enzyme
MCCVLLGLVITAPFAFAEEQASISRLPPLPQPLDPILQDMFDKRRAMGGAIINLTLTTGHAPKFTRASGTMAFTIRFETSTPRRLIELVIFRTAQIVGSDYELNQHAPLMKMCGYSNEQIAEVADWRRSMFFDDKQRALLGYVEQMANGGNVDDLTFAEFGRFFTPQQIIEISYTVYLLQHWAFDEGPQNSAGNRRTPHRAWGMLGPNVQIIFLGNGDH